jgi:hypothetical protein
MSVNGSVRVRPADEALDAQFVRLDLVRDTSLADAVHTVGEFELPPRRRRPKHPS